MAQIDSPQSVTSNSNSNSEAPKTQSREQLDEAARALTSRLGEEASALGSETKQLAQDFAQEARGTAQAKLSGGKEWAARGIASVAEALRTSGEQLRAQEEEGLPRYVEGAADKLEKVSDYLRDADLSEVVQDVETFARREPLLFVGGAFALGLFGGRFLKSSQRRSATDSADVETLESSGGNAVLKSSSRRPKGGKSTSSQRGARSATASQLDAGSGATTNPTGTGPDGA